MEQDIYQPPGSNVDIPAIRKGSPIKAILIAVVVDVVGTIVLGIIMGVSYAVILGANGVKPEVINERLRHMETFSAFSLTGIVLGGLVTILAGYLCAKIANYSEYKFAAIYGVLMTVLGLATGGFKRHSIMVMLLLAAITMLCALTGAWLHVRKKQA